MIGSRQTSTIRFPNRKAPLAAALLLGLALAAWIPGSLPAPAAPPTSGTVSTVLDGDTIVLHSGERVRYLGLDAPEIAHNGSPGDCYGDEARQANRDLVLHQRVTLQYEREAKDRHGRLLAYVVLQDGRCVNSELIRTGMARVFRSREGFSRFEELVALQREALSSRRGLWGACVVKPARFYVANRSSWVFHRADCPFGRATGARNTLHFAARWSALGEGFSPCRRCKP